MAKPSEVIRETDPEKLKDLVWDAEQKEMIRCAALDGYMTLGRNGKNGKRPTKSERLGLIDALKNPADEKSRKSERLCITRDQWEAELRPRTQKALSRTHGAIPRGGMPVATLGGVPAVRTEGSMKAAIRTRGGLRPEPSTSLADWHSRLVD